jgi:hypothetical protein
MEAFTCETCDFIALVFGYTLRVSLYENCTDVRSTMTHANCTGVDSVGYIARAEAELMKLAGLGLTVIVAAQVLISVVAAANSAIAILPSPRVVPSLMTLNSIAQIAFVQRSYM